MRFSIKIQFVPNKSKFLRFQKQTFSVTLLLLLLVYNSSKLLAQTNTIQDSLITVYESLKDGIPKVQTLEELFYNNVYNNAYEGEKYARLAQNLSTKISYSSGFNTSMYHIGVSKQLQTQLDSAMIYYKKTLDIYKKINDKGHYASTISAISDLERRRGNYDEAIKLQEEGTLIQKELNDQLRYGIGVGNIGNIYQDKGNYLIALKKSIKALKILDTVSQEPWRKADVLRQIGRIEHARENYQESIIYLKKALKVYEETNDNIWQGYTLDDIGLNYLNLKKFDKAKVYFNKSIDIAKKNNIKDVEANALTNLGFLNYEIENYNLAKSQIEKALIFNRSINEMSNIMNNLSGLSKVALKTKHYKKAKHYINEGLVISDSIKVPESTASFYNYRSKLFEQTGLYKQALEDQRRSQTINDSLLKVNKNKEIEELKTIYQTEQKEKELLLKDQEIELLEVRKKKNESQRLLLLIGLASVLIIGFSIIYGLRQKMKRNKLEREKLNTSLAFKEKKLTTHALHLAHKNDLLHNLKAKVKDLKYEAGNNRQYQNIINSINIDINNDTNWEQFRLYFEDVHKGFNTKVKQTYPEISNNDLRLMSLLKMNLTSKEIASILNISNEGVKKARYRLRKKLNLQSINSLEDTIMAI